MGSSPPFETYHTERPSPMARQSGQTGVRKSVPAGLLRQLLQTVCTLHSKQNNYYASFGCQLLIVNRCIRLFNRILQSTDQRATMELKPIARRTIPYPMGTCCKDQWCPHVMQTALATDGNGTPTVRATPIMGEATAMERSCSCIPLGLLCGGK